MLRSKLRLFITYLEENRNPSFTTAQWKEAIKKAELEEEDILALRSMARQHKERSDLLRERQEWEEAVDELDRAFLLSPPSKDHFLQMAILYRVIYENDSFHKKDRKKSLEYLEYIKDEPAYKGRVRNLTRDLEKLSHLLEPKPEKDRRFLFLLIPLFIAVGLMIFTQREYILLWASGLFSEEKENTSLMVENNNSSFRNLETYGLEDKGYRMDLQKSEILDWNGHDAYLLQGDFSNINGNADKLSLKLRYLDENSELLKEVPLPAELLQNNTLVPGETLPVDYFEYLTINPQKINRLSLILETSGEIPGIQRNPEDLNLLWEIQRPEGVSLDAEIGSVEYLEAYDRFYYRFIIILENTGSKEIRDLRVRMDGFGQKLSPFQMESFHPVQGEGLPLQKGQKRPIPLLFMVNHEELEPQNEWVLRIESLE